MWDFSHALQFTKTKGEYQAEHLSYYNALCAVFPYWRIAYRIHVAAPPDRTRYVENSSDCTPRVGILQHTSRQIVAMATLATKATRSVTF